MRVSTSLGRWACWLVVLLGRVHGVQAQGPAPTWQWAHQSQGTGTVWPFDMAVDAAGNTYVVGVLYGTMTLDNGLQLVASATNDADGFVVKYTPTGAVAWAHRLGAAPGYDTANGVALDAAGNVYVTGQFSGQVSVGSFLLNAFPGSGAYLVKYDAQGVAQWARQSTTQSVGQTAIGHDVELDAAGNIYTTGTISWGGLLWPRAAYPRPGSLLYALCGQVRCGRHGAMGASRGLDDC